MTAVPSVHVTGLTKSYGSFQAVKGVDFDIFPGEVFGLLGPNGAGKTTTVEILEGLRPRSGGEVAVLGFDPGRESRHLKDRIGVCLQATNLPDKITLSEAMGVFASLYSRTVDGGALLQRLQLWDKRDAPYGKLSGGQKQRLALALALINDPQLLFLDEPSAGLDPQARLEIHELVQELRREQRTILLTTHYIEEAQQLADRVAVIRSGTIVRLGTPEELIGETGSVEIRFRRDGEAVAIETAEPTRVLHELTSEALSSGRELEQLEVRRPTLEDVYLELVDEEREEE
jgi:ABC-2 type transport system ATP-binding protein